MEAALPTQGRKGESRFQWFLILQIRHDLAETPGVWIFHGNKKLSLEAQPAPLRGLQQAVTRWSSRTS